MAITTFDITLNAAGILNPGLLLDLDDTANVTVNRTNNQTTQIDVDASINPGRFDLSQLLVGTDAKQQGSSFELIRASCTSDGGPNAGGSWLRQAVGVSLNAEVFQALDADGGQYVGTPLVFPFGYTLGVGTTDTGPHRVVLVIKQMGAEDTLGVA
jgi:hypothetical protein